MNSLLQLLGALLLFLGLIFGLGLPLVATTRLAASEKICAGAALGMIVLYLVGLAFYWADIPVFAYRLLPAAAAALVAARWPACRAVLRDPAARRMLVSYLLVTSWCLGFLALVRNYSGAAWALDWAGHYDRAGLFALHWPASLVLFGGDFLPTRPPLANAVTGVFLAQAGTGFPLFQIFTTLASTLAFLPGWLFARRFGRGRRLAPAVFTVLYMLNPSVMENSTFAWTKLPTVFFVLTGLYFFLPALKSGSRGRVAAAFGFLAAGFLTHYSAGPYVAALALAYCWWRRARWLTRGFWADIAVCALPAALLLATWFGWSVKEFGVARTFLENTSVTESTVHSPASFVEEKGLNLYFTLVPFPLRGADDSLIDQRSKLGYVRDYFFLLYQVDLPTLFGIFGGMLLGALLWRAWREPPDARPGWPPRSFWAWFIGCTVVLGTAANGGINRLGIAHLCLQGLVGLGLAFVAARLDRLPRRWQAVFAAGVAWDFIFGVGLQFFLENQIHSTQAFQQDHGRELRALYGIGTEANVHAKIMLGMDYVGDWPLPRPLLLTLLAALLALALARAQRARREPGPATTA